MTPEQKIYSAIKDARRLAANGEKTAELHLQFLKYAKELDRVDRVSVCEELGIPETYKTELGKMRNIVDRLVAAGLDVSKI